MTPPLAMAAAMFESMGSVTFMRPRSIIFLLLFKDFRARITTMREKRRARGRRVPPGLFVGLLVLSTWSAGATFPFDSLRNAQCDFWQTSDGLPNHDVVSLAQTPDGCLWVGMYGSSNSLVRFNGFEFVPAVKLAGASMRTCLASGKEGRLWICRASGAGPLVRWQRGMAIPIETTLPPPIDGWIAMCEDRQGNLWMGGGGVLVRTPEGQTIDYRELTNTFGNVRGIAEGKNKTMWFATDQGLVRHRDGAFDRPYPITNKLCSVFSSKEGSLWLGTDGEPGLFQVNSSGMIVRYGAQGLNSRGVWAICEDREANIWLGTYSGLYYVRDRRVYPIQDTDLRTAFIFSVLWDREGSLWVGTSDGLYHLCRNPIEHYGAAAGLGPVSSLSSSGLQCRWGLE